MSLVLSLITPCFRSQEADLKKILEELLKHRNKIQWVLVNDEPENQKLSALLMHLAEQFDFIRLVNNPENLGMFEAYCRGFEIADGAWSAILDHDDRIHLSEIMSQLEQLLPFYDLIYTDEYKFEEEGKMTSQYIKPYFDPLSALHYFYTHHLTFFKQDIIKTFISERLVEKYPSCFDLWLNANYIKQFIKRGQELRWKLLPVLAYGWRIHENSTAKNIQSVRPSQLGERIELFEEIFSEFGEICICQIDSKVLYLVDANFMPCLDPRPNKQNLNELEELTHFVQGQRKKYLFRPLGVINNDEAKYFNFLIKKLPLNLLFKQSSNSVCLMNPRNIAPYFNNDPRWVSHPAGVPYLVEMQTSDLIQTNQPMVFISEVGAETTERIRVAMVN